MAARHTLEVKFEIWNDDHGERVEIGEDSDGLGMMELRHRDPGGRITDRVTFSVEAIPLAIEAMQRLQAFLHEREAKETEAKRAAANAVDHSDRYGK